MQISLHIKAPLHKKMGGGGIYQYTAVVHTDLPLLDGGRGSFAAGFSSPLGPLALGSVDSCPRVSGVRRAVRMNT